MKDFAANLIFAVGVIVAVVIWYSYSNNFSGVIATKNEPAISQNLPPAVVITSPIVKTLVVDENLLKSSYCKNQHEDFLKEKSHSTLVAAREVNPGRYDIKCFVFPDLSDQIALENCLIGDVKKSAEASSMIDSVMCKAFLKIYQAYATDFLYPDDVDIKGLNQIALQRKIQAHLLKQMPNPALLKEMVQTLVTTYPNNFEAVKLYIKAVGFGQKPEIYADNGPLFPYLKKAYSLNPRDIEICEMYMYGLIQSANGDVKLLKAFPNVKDKSKVQALRYYYLAWAAWIREDRTQTLNNLEFAKALSKNDTRYTEAYEKVKNELNKPKSEGVFYLSLSVI